MTTKAVLALLACLSCVAPAWAQLPINPFEIEFDPSTDHAIVTSYEVGFFFAGATNPVSTEDVGKPALVTGKVVAQLASKPTSLGQYEMKVRSRGTGGAVSAWAAGGPQGNVPVPFVRALLPPMNLVIRH